MPQSVASEPAEHFAEHPVPSKSSCPGEGPEPEREAKTFPLMLTTTYGNAVRADIFNVEVWKPTLAAAGVIPVREKGGRWRVSRKDGFHVLRHTYASIVLEAGGSMVTLARWLGHSSPTMLSFRFGHHSW
ncbi:Tyrosine-type recombinase/integrase OS=Streptomyces rimosus subsp. rimosus (strain ATCC / DSM 40260 / JCM 4667 / NRRL 2234) OX=1265868 GN=SRIM_011560 PE=4 SV=1 [Streptomyces rimosus subsp. rimosus]